METPWDGSFSLSGVERRPWCCRPGLLFLGLFQKLSSGGGGQQFLSDPSTPRTNMESEPPRPPGHVSALITPPHYGSSMPWPPGQVTPTPHPSDKLSTKHPQPTGQKKCLRPPPRIISGTALSRESPQQETYPGPQYMNGKAIHGLFTGYLILRGVWLKSFQSPYEPFKV